MDLLSWFRGFFAAHCFHCGAVLDRRTRVGRFCSQECKEQYGDPDAR